MVATEFIVKRPKTSRGFDAIAKWVDKMSRQVHFIACKETNTAPDVEPAFFTHIVSHHELLESIGSDRDPRFISSFWTSLMALCGLNA